MKLNMTARQPLRIELVVVYSIYLSSLNYGHCIVNSMKLTTCIEQKHYFVSGFIKVE